LISQIVDVRVARFLHTLANLKNFSVIANILANSRLVCKRNSKESAIIIFTTRILISHAEDRHVQNNGIFNANFVISISNK